MVTARRKRASERIDELIERAVTEGATFGQQPPEMPERSPVTRSEFEAALADCADHISRAQRMTFWQPDGKRGHEWTSHPERHSTILVRACLAMRFRDALEDFQEVATGAGRIDLLVHLSGGLKLILELKMCGGGYTENYAKEGLSQLQHYMETKRTGLGYLLVFDGRKRDFGKGLAATNLCKAGTMFVRFIDVRSTIAKGGTDDQSPPAAR